MRTLVIMIDGLPHEQLDPTRTPFISSLSHRSLRPGFGYSCNIYPEILAGLNPDRLGFLNKWTLVDDPAARVPGALARGIRALADGTRVSNRASRALHKVAERALGVVQDNVPWRYLPYFEWQDEKGVFDKPAYPTIFSHGPWRFAMGNRISRPGGERDEPAAEEAVRAIRSGDNVFALLADVDAVGHATGTGEMFRQQIATADRLASDLAAAFRERHGKDAPVVVFSDHGMKEVRSDGGIAFAPERRHGQATPGRYLYFAEATMLRLWFWDERLRTRILGDLERQGGSFLLSASDRQRYGVTSSRFGHEIFMLDEGRVLFPSFFGGRFPRALHGYHPEFPSQQAVVACNIPGVALPASASEMFGFLQKIVVAGE